jgi:hypothetical protein
MRNEKIYLVVAGLQDANVIMEGTYTAAYIYALSREQSELNLKHIICFFTKHWLYPIRRLLRRLLLHRLRLHPHHNRHPAGCLLLHHHLSLFLDHPS